MDDAAKSRARALAIAAFVAAVMTGIFWLGVRSAEHWTGGFFGSQNSLRNLVMRVNAPALFLPLYASDWRDRLLGADSAPWSNTVYTGMMYLTAFVQWLLVALAVSWFVSRIRRRMRGRRSQSLQDGCRAAK